MKALTPAAPALLPVQWCHPTSGQWQDINSTTPAVANNDPVILWNDVISPGISPFTGTSTKRPLLQTNVLNGYAGIKSDGVDDVLGNAMTAYAAQTWFLVAKKTAAPGAAEKTLLGIRQATNNRARPVTSTTAAVPGANGYGYFPNEAVGYSAFPSPSAITNWHIIAWRATASSAQTWVDGGASNTHDPHDNVATSNVFTLCADNTGSFGDYTLCEFMRFSSALALPDMDRIGRRLAEKYALTWAAAS